MGNPLDRPSRSDRRAAKRQVEDAVRAGVIVQADGDLRIQQVESATSVADVEGQVRDLANRHAQATYVAPLPTGTAAQPTAPQAPPPNPYGAVSPRITSAVRGRRVAAAVARVPRRRVLPIVLVVFFFGSVINTTVHGFIDSFSSPSVSRPEIEKIDMFTDEAITRLKADLLARTGTTQADRVVMYPDYASAQVRTGDGLTVYSWRGRLEEQSTADTGVDRPSIDFAAYDPAVIIAMRQRALDELVDAPTSSYVIVQPPLGGNGDRGGATIYAYASDTDGHGGYISATQDGTEVRVVRY